MLHCFPKCEEMFQKLPAGKVSKPMATTRGPNRGATSRYGEAIEIVSKRDGTGKVLTYFRQALLFLTEGPEHPVGQHEPLDVRFLSDLSDRRGRHVQPSL